MQVDVCQSRKLQSAVNQEGKERGIEPEEPTVMVTNFPAIAFILRVSAKARLLNKRYSKHLERSEHKNIEDLREDISCGRQLQRK